MIRTSTQLKALVRNKSNGDSTKAQMIIRNYMMERFLERISLSKYKEHIILKGGTLIAALVGVNERSTMDIDTTLKHLELSESVVREITEEIIKIELEDNIKFEITKVESIMEISEYPGIRVSLISEIERMRTPLKLDFSTGDRITPSELEFDYPLMFEDRTIKIMAYNIETVLAEKLETVISLGVANTRMRDFYDIHILLALKYVLNESDLYTAIKNTFEKRETSRDIKEWHLIIQENETNLEMQELWNNYQKRFEYAENISWNNIIESINELIQIYKSRQ